MKYLKKYEDLNNDIEIGDYVYCQVETDIYNPKHFIGKVEDIKPLRKKFPYRIQYPIIAPEDENEDNIDNPLRLVNRDEIIAHAKTLEDLEYCIKGAKYNL